MGIDGFGRAQHGLVAVYQALEVLSPAQLENELSSGRLIPHRRRVYRCRGAPGSYVQEVLAAILAIGLGAAVACRNTAARLHGIPDVPAVLVEVLTLRSKKPVLSGVRVHTSNYLPAHHVTLTHGVPATTVARTLVDLSACLSHETWARALRGAVRLGLTTYDEVYRARDEMRARGRRRTTVVDETLTSLAGDPGDSDGEAKLVRWLIEAGFPMPEQQLWVVGTTGERFRLDLAYQAAKIDMEYDGVDAHGKPVDAFIEDRARDDSLTLSGYLVIRATKRTSRRTFLRRVFAALQERSPGLCPTSPP
ncbi:MAG TPA: hypothetical protein VFB78_03095 [Acidimicrobiales bacterium]|nr:hypothetical protein [Acidimicrobiales bacterium]